ncbi:MAG: 2TM domain-containing protein [Candidatus Thermoplasmatota archaeon]
MTASSLADDDIRRMARARVRFRYSIVTFLIVNAMLVVIWYFSGDRSPSADGGMPWGFWPAWVMLFWGVGLAFQGWHAYGRAPDAVAREEAKLRERYGR